MEAIGTTTVLLPIPEPPDPGIRGEPQTLPPKPWEPSRVTGGRLILQSCPVIRVQVPKNQPETPNP